MIRINLLPTEYAEAQRRKEQKILAFCGGGFLSTLLLVVWFVEMRTAVSLRKTVTEREATLAGYQAIISQIEAIEAEKKAMIQKRDVIKNLNRSRLLYPVFFEDFLPIIPSDVWVTSIQIAEQGDQMKVTMNCNALSNFALATWLTNLQQSKHFSGIDLGSISYANSDQGSSVLSFPLGVKYRHQGPFPLEEKS